MRRPRRRLVFRVMTWVAVLVALEATAVVGWYVGLGSCG